MKGRWLIRLRPLHFGVGAEDFPERTPNKAESSTLLIAVPMEVIGRKAIPRCSVQQFKLLLIKVLDMRREQRAWMFLDFICNKLRVRFFGALLKYVEVQLLQTLFEIIYLA